MRRFRELALKWDPSKPLTKVDRLRMSERHAIRQTELIDEIVEAAEKIAAARGMTGEPVFRTDPVWVLLKAVESASYCCSLSDVGRLLDISRQHARRIAFAAAGRGLVELARNDHDRRILQLLLTESGRAELGRVRHERRIWTAQVLLGLDTPRLRVATHVVRVIRQRLAQAAREGRSAAKSSGTKPRW